MIKPYPNQKRAKLELSPGQHILFSAKDEAGKALCIHKDVVKEAAESDGTSEKMALAAEIDQFYYDYDYYGYMDAFDSREEALTQLQDDFRTNQVSGLKDWIKEVIEACDDPQYLSKAKDYLSRVEKLFPEKEALQFPFVSAETQEIVNTGEVIRVEYVPMSAANGSVAIDNINGKGTMISLELSSITLYYEAVRDK